MCDEWNREEVEYETLSSFVSSRDFTSMLIEREETVWRADHPVRR
jgi:hypothetical protein